MKRKGLKIALALFLAVGGLVVPLTFKKSVRAANIQLNENYYLPLLHITGVFPYNPGSDIIKDVYGNRLVFRNDDIESIIGSKYFSIRYGWNGSTLQFLIYLATTGNMYDTPIYSISYSYSVYGSNPTFIYSNIIVGPSSTMLENNKYIFLQYLARDGIECVDGYSTPTGTSSKYIDSTSIGYYMFFAGFVSREKRVDIWNEGRIAGINHVLDFPEDYDLFDEQTVLEMVENAYDEGHDDGYDEGYDEGYGKTTNFLYIIKNIFDSASNFLNVELVGGLKVIHFITIPLLLGLFLIVMKILRS